MSAPSRRTGKIVLYRQQVELILVQVMGWEQEDAMRFWQYARWKTSNPGCIEQMLRREIGRLMADIEQDGAPLGAPSRSDRTVFPPTRSRR